MGNSSLSQSLERGVVENLTVLSDQTAVPVIRVFAEADVGQYDTGVPQAPDLLDGLLDDSFIVGSLGTDGILLDRDPEQEHTTQASLFGLSDDRRERLEGPTEHTRHGRNFCGLVFDFGHEDR